MEQDASNKYIWISKLRNSCRQNKITVSTHSTFRWAIYERNATWELNHVHIVTLSVHVLKCLMSSVSKVDRRLKLEILLRRNLRSSSASFMRSLTKSKATIMHFNSALHFQIYKTWIVCNFRKVKFHKSRQIWNTHLIFYNFTSVCYLLKATFLVNFDTAINYRRLISTFLIWRMWCSSSFS